ncbi:hypothetical protein B0A55_09611 [Friedmanniomyces simplex]|uniref:JmjC domain-containing protein n=1 Tax=Friedmanniomyces simplex TaxID=329884 RepID=A0A4U0WLX6_9PEZI|nr:hypothetical protein B0A55_09611 [Friedmanniomyces simplex]
MYTHGTFVAQDTDEKSVPHDRDDDQSALPGQKRKASGVLVMQSHDDDNDNNQHRANELLQSLAEQIQDALNVATPDEAVQQCGQAPLRIIATHPDKVLELAHTKLHASPFQSVPLHWRRLFEEASLHKVAKLLKDRALRVHPEDRAKRRRIDNHTAVASHSGDWLLGIVEVLDRGISLSGAPGRKYVFDGIFEQLGEHIANEATPDWTCFRIIKPPDLKSTHPIIRKSGPFDHETFQEHLRIDCQPVIITGAIENWPARQLWENPEYLLRHTLGGRRFVPVEVGESYVSDGWSQRMMPMRDFVETYLLPDDTAETGYLAQYDLFAQIPALRHDVRIPDICYSDPPPANADALRTAGLSTVEQLDEPLLNAWLGPKGTKTPLHTDPYHNVLCQVVGYKYVRLYPPSETDRLYPRGVDEKGINMENTSRVDMSRLWSLVHDSLAEEVDQENREFPLFQEARFVEAVLGPGDSLYVPLGWWHYVESLTTSFSVSFWWN